MSHVRGACRTRRARRGRCAALWDGVAASQIGRPATRQTEAARGRSDSVRTAPSRSSATRLGPVSEISSRPSSPWTTSARRLPSRPSACASGSTHSRREDAEQLRRRAGRVGERPEQIEDRAHADLAPRRGDVAHRRMKALREQEADADLVEARGHLLGRQIDADAERLQNVGAADRAGHGAVAVLGDRHARRRRRRTRPRSRC